MAVIYNSFKIKISISCLPVENSNLYKNNYKDDAAAENKPVRVGEIFVVTFFNYG